MHARPTLLCTLALLSSASAQTPVQPPLQTPARRPHPAENNNKSAAAQLPVTRVALYKNGVGFFEHSGRVQNTQSVTIDFTSAQLNDVLQSLTAIDLQGGRIAGAAYNSTTPLEQQLKSLPLALGADATEADFYAAIRGARVEVHAAGASITGRLLSVEDRTSAATQNQPAVTRQFITVVSDTGEVRTLELTPATSVRLLDTTLHTDVTRYLELLASTRNAGLRHLTLEDRGTGSRDLHVSYISEVPVWKSTYRILFTDTPQTSKCGPMMTDAITCILTNQTATLQGWSVVDNTTGSDWLNVHLSLIAGAPQSFIQPLSTPYYTRRPEIPLPTEAQLTPQTHESGDASQGTGIQGTITDATGAVIPNARITATNTATGAQTLGSTDGSGSFNISLPQTGTYTIEASMPGFQTLRRSNVQVSGEEFASLDLRLNVGSVAQSITVDAASVSDLPTNGRAMSKARISAGAGGNMGGGVYALAAPARPPRAYADLAQASLTPQTTTSAFDDYFEYTLTDPITIRKNESALVPILQTRLPVERVTLWSPQQPVALRALWITNASTYTLDRGSFSIVENGNFGGEGLLDPIHPGERRLLSYAADQAVRVTQSAQNNTRRVQHLTIKAGVLTETSTDIADLTYDIRNAAPDPRTVVVEHPVRQGWELTGPSGPPSDTPKPAETTPTTERFKVQVAPSHTEHLHLAERHTNLEYIRLVDRTEDQLILLVRNAHASPATLAALQPVFDAHHKVVALDAQIQTLQQEINEITQDQNRLRENMKALKGSPEEKALLTRYTGELNTQEDRLSAVRSQIAQLQAQRTAADQDFQQKLESVNLDESL